MKLTLGRAAVAAALGLFCLSATAPAPALALDKAPAAQKMQTAHKSAHKMAKKRGPSKTVMKLQEALNKTGAGLKVDGLWGHKTRAALKKYQAANGIKASGRLDKTTRKKLMI